MLKLRTDKIDTLRVWKWCQDSFADHGIKLNFPKGTDYTKTYQWRYASALLRQFDEWEFDEGTSRAFIATSVRYLKERGLLRKGMAAFMQRNLLENCYKRLEIANNTQQDLHETLRFAKSFIDDKCAGRDPISVLTKRVAFDEDCNLVRWHQSAKIPKLYIAASVRCMAAVAKLTRTAPAQRLLLPNNSELFLEYRAISNRPDRHIIKNILGGDWRSLCLR